MLIFLCAERETVFLIVISCWWQLLPVGWEILTPKRSSSSKPYLQRARKRPWRSWWRMLTGAVRQAGSIVFVAQRREMESPLLRPPMLGFVCRRGT